MNTFSYIQILMDVPLLSVMYLMLAILTWRAVVGDDRGGDHYDHRFHVNSTNTSCCNLDTVLQQAHNRSSNTSVYISLAAGQFTLSSNQLATFYNWSKLALVGENKSKSVVHCERGVGLTFLDSAVIVLRNLTICGCGANHLSTSRHPNSTGQEFKYLEFHSALYFLACADITMEDVSVSDSTCTGLVIYNSDGTNRFVQCEFSGNPVSTREHGGGGVVVEFSHCTPGDTTCNNSASSVQVVNSTYLFRKCHFENNVASAGNLSRESTYSHGTEHMAFGKGGALAVHFKGRSKDNSILLEDCNIYGNGATWSGGGIYLGFGDQSINNSVHMYTVVPGRDSNVLILNYYPLLPSGGGARIEFIHYPSDHQLWSGYTSKVVNNSVVFNRTRFGGNIAHVGGGVSIATSREGPGEEATNSLVFESCQFEGNMAFVAFAVDLSLQRPDITSANGAVMAPLFRNCEISGNYQYISNLTHYRDSIAAFYANHVPARFEGITNFTNNLGSAMVVSETYVILMNSSSMNFTGNKGRRGGALSFIGNAWLVAYEATELTFVNNSVGMDGKGGAIYAVHFDEHDVLNSQNCFFKYYKYLEHPSQWNTKLTFVGNTAKFNKTNSIYVSSVFPCAQLKPNSTLSETFCSHPWKFQDDNSNCSTQVATGPSKMSVSNVSIRAVPGWDNKVGIHIHNDYNVEIPAIYMAAPRNETDWKVARVSNKTEYISDDNIRVFGKPNQSAELLFTTLDPRVILSVLYVEILSCPPGFGPISCSDEPDMICDCRCANPGAGMTCNDQSHKASLLSYYCLTHKFYSNNTINSSSHLIFGECPYNQQRIHLNDISNLEEGVCGPSNRNGTLCSKCREGYGVDINSYNFKCIPCHVKTGWLMYLVLEILPITLFFMLIAILNISATSAPMNAFVFFSQIASIPYFRNPYPFFFSPIFLDNKWLQTSVLLPYAVWNLDFFRTSLFPGVCLSTHITTMEALALNYVKAFYPMLLILVCYVLIRLYDYNLRVVHWLWKPFRWCLKRLHKRHGPKTSIIDAFATFLLLSYTKFMFVSFPLLTPQTLYDGEASQSTSLRQVVFYYDASVQFSGKYLVLGVVAIIIVVIFVVLPPLLLIAYPMRMFQKCIGRLPFRIAIKTFADAFQGDFRNGIEQGMDCRCFSGLYFLFRIAIFIIFVIPLGLAQQYLIQQIFFNCCIILFTMMKPYREEFYNKLDISFFFLLSLMNALSFYSSQIYENHEDQSVPVFVINYILGLLPMFYIAGMVGYVVLIWMGCLKKHVILKPSEDIVIIGDTGSEDDTTEPLTYVYNPHSKSEEDIPDRLLNPQNYTSRNMYKAPNANAGGRSTTSGSASQAATKKILSEGSYFLQKEGQRELRPYGSTSATEPPVKFKGQHTQLKDLPDEI